MTAAAPAISSANRISAAHISPFMAISPPLSIVTGALETVRRTVPAPGPAGPAAGWAPPASARPRRWSGARSFHPGARTHAAARRARGRHRPSARRGGATAPLWQGAPALCRSALSALSFDQVTSMTTRPPSSTTPAMTTAVQISELMTHLCKCRQFGARGRDRGDRACAWHAYWGWGVAHRSETKDSQSKLTHAVP